MMKLLYNPHYSRYRGLIKYTEHVCKKGKVEFLPLESRDTTTLQTLDSETVECYIGPKNIRKFLKSLDEAV